MDDIIYVTSQGEVFQAAFNAIAAYFNSEASNTLIWATGMIGMFAVVCKFLMKSDLKMILWWVGCYTFMSLFLIEGKTDVFIYDTTRPMGNIVAVDNVPNGLALPASWVTGVSRYVTETVTDIMHAPNDKTYEKTGMVWGATIFQQMNAARVNTELLGYWSRYLYQCVWTDIKVRKKYTLDDLSKQPDILAFLKKQEEPRRGDGGYLRVHIPNANPNEAGAEDFPRCGVAFDWLENQFKKDSLLSFANIHKFNANAMTDTVAKMQQSVQDVYSHFFNMSASSQNIMMQNLAINAMRDGFQNIAQSRNPAAASLNYAKTQSEMSRTSSWISAGVMAQEYVPMIHTILMLIVCCAFIPVVYMCFFPGYFFRIIGKYIGSFIWLGTWPLFFVFINFVMTTIMSVHLSMQEGGLGGLTLSTIDGASALAWRYTALTGWMLMFVPYLSRMLVMGAGSTMMGVATSMTSQLSSDAEKGARGLSEGSFELANTTVAQHQMNNVSGHQTLLQPNTTYGGARESLMAGGSRMQTLNGVTYNNSGVVDQQPFELRSGQTVSTGLSQTQSMYEKMAQSDAMAFNESYQAGISDISQAGTNQALKDYISSSNSTSKTGQLAQAYATVADIHNRYSQDQIASGVSSLNREVGAEIKYNGGVIGKGLKMVAGLDGNVYAKGNQSWSDSKTSNNSVGMTADDAKSYREAMDTIKTVTQSDAATLDKAIGVDQGKSLQSNFNKAFAYSESAQRNNELANQAGEAANYAKNNDFGFSQNKMPDFNNYIHSNYADQAGAWLGDISRQNDPQFKQAQADFVQANSDVYLDWYRENAASIDSRAQTEINSNNQRFNNGKDIIDTEKEANHRQVDKESSINQSNLEYDIHQIRGETMQSTMSNYERLNQATLAEMRRLGLTTDQPPVIEQPKNPFDLERPDMSELNKINEQVQQHGGEVLADRDNRADNIIKKTGGNLNHLERNDSVKLFNQEDLNQKNKDAAIENSQLGKDAWRNLFGDKK
ncbi:conjugal transfer protein TraG N-terminal domain-containing protein [Cysteiniphilum marinum]|uniref:conjugal transfer protein TraG N-terminal domain-containing protein n=3 Tax=Cysteiniphilum TaxID=2056696 RepID=UPI00177AEA7A|nr:conjugal transfer protein TraG N-terminal domain-containing protein [Cysteiniphilum marinum]